MGTNLPAEGKCPVVGQGGQARTTSHATRLARMNRDWWPNQLHLNLLCQNPPQANP